MISKINLLLIEFCFSFHSNLNHLPKQPKRTRAHSYAGHNPDQWAGWSHRQLWRPPRVPATRSAPRSRASSSRTDPPTHSGPRATVLVFLDLDLSKSDRQHDPPGLHSPYGLHLPRTSAMLLVGSTRAGNSFMKIRNSKGPNIDP